MIGSASLITIFLVIAVSFAQMSPSWAQDNNIDAGESKPINFDICFSTPQTRNAGASYNYTQAFNKTDFNVIPRVALAQISFDFFYTTTMAMGYRIGIKTITNKTVIFGVQTVGVQICGLHFMYIAVSPVYDAYYFISFYNFTFNAADNVTNTSAGSIRTQTALLNYPKNQTLPIGYSQSTFTFQAWIVWYVFTPGNSLAINISSNFNSTTQMIVTMTVSDNFKLSELGIVGVLVDNNGIYQYSYTLFIDKFYNDQIGNTSIITPRSNTITDFNSQYQYRGTLTGLTVQNISLVASPNLTWFYFNYSSSSGSFFTGYAINARARYCDPPYTLYFYQNSTCITACPEYYHTNSSFKYCIKCHSTCLNCSLPADSNACTQCEAATFRELVNSTCSCKAHYFSNNTLICADCHVNCLTCSNQLVNSCLSCDSTIHRTLNNSICICQSGYYQNTTCLACTGLCLTCNYATATSTYTCLTCSLTNNRTLDSTNTSCICISAYYPVTSSCLACDLGCLNCTGPAACTLCDSTAHFALANGVCSCFPAYYSGSNNCLACDLGCLNCTGSSACTLCDSTAHFTLANSLCGCMSAYYFLSNNCLACDSGCLNCTGPSACTLCDSSANFELANGVCSCLPAYYSSTNNCLACDIGCLNCTGTAACTLCNSAVNFTLANGICNCPSAYYPSINNCLVCDFACLNCTGPSACTLCNSAAHFGLSSGICSCLPTYSLSNSTCVQTSAICGNGILQLSEQCDDDNTQNGDGCSSTCTVQPSYTCINNASVYVYSLCYYSDAITLVLDYVYKIPLQNAGQIIILVFASNINQTALKKYLQSRAAVAFSAQGRLLANNIIQQTATYNTETGKLQIQFTYTSDIDLPSFTLQLKPSFSNQTNAKYFYATPTADITLTAPTNKLLTTFIEPSDLSRQTVITWLFLTLIILSWIYLLVAIAYRQGAMAVEFFMILQVTYQSLLQSGFIYDGWVGLIFFGKYTYGLNADNIISAGPDTLKTLGLTIPLLNTLNVTVAICFIAVLLVLIIFIYQLAEISKQTETLQTKATNDKIQLGRQTAREFNHASYQVKKGIFLTSLQAGFAIVFITCRIVVISISLAIKQGQYIASSLFPALVLSACALVLFLFYYKFFEFQAMTELSYRRLLTILKKDIPQQSSLKATLSNLLIKYHYLLIFVLMIVFAMVDALTSIGIGLYVSVGVGALVWWIVIAINRNYLRKLHLVRTAINSLCLITTMVTLLVQTLNILNPSQNIVAPLIGMSMLFFSLVFHISILVRIEYKRRRKRNYKKKVNRVHNVVVLREKFDTQVPVQIVRNRDQEHIDRSHIDLGGGIKQKQKFDDISVSNDDSRQYTRKKIVIEDRFNQSTRHKQYPRASSPYSAQKMQGTQPKGWNAELAEEEHQSQENNNENIENTVKNKVRKQIEFEDY